MDHLISGCQNIRYSDPQSTHVKIVTMLDVVLENEIEHFGNLLTNVKIVTMLDVVLENEVEHFGNLLTKFDIFCIGISSPPFLSLCRTNPKKKFELYSGGSKTEHVRISNGKGLF